MFFIAGGQLFNSKLVFSVSKDHYPPRRDQTQEFIIRLESLSGYSRSLSFDNIEDRDKEYNRVTQTLQLSG